MVGPKVPEVNYVGDFEPRPSVAVEVLTPPRGRLVAEAAAEYVGVRELTGRNDGPEVEYFLALTGLGRGYAWCGSFAYAAHVEAGVIPKPPPSAYAWTPTWFVGAKQIPMGSIMPGDVVGIYFPSLGRIAHMAIAEERNGHTVTTIEGNTNDGGSRDGEGVYRRYRKTGTLKAAARWW